MSLSILWVNEEYDGPMNGVAEFNGNKLWFVRFNTPSIIPSDIIVSIGTQEYDRLYQLYSVDEESMKVLVDNHERYCTETGAPLNHGDSRKVKQLRKDNLPILGRDHEPTGETIQKTTFSKPFEIKKFIHNLPKNIQAEYVSTVRESEFSNYLVSHKLEFI